MRKTFKYRLLGSKTTFANAEKWLGLCRNLYNAALEERITAYKTSRVSLSCYNQMKELPELRVIFPEYKNVDAQVLQNVVERLDRAYRSFFLRLKKGKGKAGFPRFKGKDRYHSFTLKQSSWKLDGKYLTVRNIGRFKIRLSRPVDGIIKTVTLRRSIGTWYVCFSCDKVTEKQLTENNNAVGLDVGIKSFVVDSDGNIVDNPSYHKATLKLLRRKQRMLCRRQKGGSNRRKARMRVAKAHEKINNQRMDFLHKTANYYIQEYGSIFVENLNIEGMARNHKLSRAIRDAGWGTFINLLEYKAAEAGRQVVRIPMFEPTSKTCSECGAIKQDLTLNDRQWVCQFCGTLHDRDYNAAKNIKMVGQTQQALTCEVAQSVACESSASEEYQNSVVAT